MKTWSLLLNLVIGSACFVGPAAASGWGAAGVAGIATSQNLDNSAFKVEFSGATTYHNQGPVRLDSSLQTPQIRSYDRLLDLQDKARYQNKLAEARLVETWSYALPVWFGDRSHQAEGAFRDVLYAQSEARRLREEIRQERQSRFPASWQPETENRGEPAPNRTHDSYGVDVRGSPARGFEAGPRGLPRLNLRELKFRTPNWDGRLR